MHKAKSQTGITLNNNKRNKTKRDSSNEVKPMRKSYLDIVQGTPREEEEPTKYEHFSYFSDGGYLSFPVRNNS
jgi:hypothetical protein